MASAADPEYAAARAKYLAAKARGDTRSQHETSLALRRAMTMRLRAEAERPRWRRLLDWVRR